MKIIILLFLFMFSPLILASELPEGWYLTSADQYLQEDVRWFKGILPNKVVVDLNDDGMQDSAWILTDKTKTKWALFVALSSDKNNKTLIKLADDEIGLHLNVGIRFMKAGRYRTACGKGYWKCKHGEPAEIEIKNGAISLHFFESSSSVYYWSENASKFIRVWLSD